MALPRMVENVGFIEKGRGDGRAVVYLLAQNANLEPVVAGSVEPRGRRAMVRGDSELGGHTHEWE